MVVKYERALIFVSLVLILTVVDAARAVTPEQQLDIPTLLAQVRDHQDALDKIKEKYTYTEIVTNVERDKHGKEKKREIETYDVSFYQHREVERLVAKNGKPISSEDQAKQQRRIEKLIAQLEAGKNPPDPDANRRMSIAVLLRAEQFENPRREVFRERNVIVFDFEPDPAFKPANSYESFYKLMKGTMWVDEADLQVARVDFGLIGPFKIGGGALFEMKPGAHFVSEQSRFFGEVWLPTSAGVTFDGRALLFFGFGIEETTTFSNYQRFDVNTEEKVKMPASPSKTENPH